MLQIKLVFSRKGELILPISYSHIVQGLVYNLLSDNSELASQIHDNGVKNAKRVYKMMSFSQLMGKFVIKDKNIVFTDKITLDIRILDTKIYETLILALSRRDFVILNGQNVEIFQVRFNKRQLTKNHYHIKMLSPIVVHSTSNRQTYYYNPLEKEFQTRLQDNFKRKYQAYYGMVPDFDFNIKPVNFMLKNKVVTQYKNYRINGWRGEYELTGDPRALDFLYQVGIGEKTAMGFGTFEVIK